MGFMGSRRAPTVVSFIASFVLRLSDEVQYRGQNNYEYSCGGSLL